MKSLILRKTRAMEKLSNGSFVKEKVNDLTFAENK